ncbi:MAG TPA: hypothetical protein VIF62_10840 [Labilithrix sp.]
MSRARIFFFGAIASALGAIAIACTAGDPIVYTTASDSGTLPSDAGSVSDAIATTDGPAFPDVQTPTLTPSSLGPCSPSVTEDGGDDPAACDPMAGEGCCFSGPGTGQCAQSWDVFLEAGTACRGPGTFYQTCSNDTPDSPCCYGRHDDPQQLFTRFAADCAGAAHACNLGDTCSDGTGCISTTCAGVVVGYCLGPNPCP